MRTLAAVLVIGALILTGCSKPPASLSAAAPSTAPQASRQAADPLVWPVPDSGLGDGWPKTVIPQTFPTEEAAFQAARTALFAQGGPRRVDLARMACRGGDYTAFTARLDAVWNGEAARVLPAPAQPRYLPLRQLPVPPADAPVATMAALGGQGPHGEERVDFVLGWPVTTDKWPGLGAAVLRIGVRSAAPGEPVGWCLEPFLSMNPVVLYASGSAADEALSRLRSGTAATYYPQ